LLEALCQAIKRSLTIYGNKSTFKHVLLGSALSPDHNSIIIQKRLLYVKYDRESTKKQVMTLIFQNFGQARVVHVLDSSPSNHQVEMKHLKISKKSYEEWAIETVQIYIVDLGKESRDLNPHLYRQMSNDYLRTLSQDNEIPCYIHMSKKSISVSSMSDPQSSKGQIDQVPSFIGYHGITLIDEHAVLRHISESVFQSTIRLVCPVENDLQASALFQTTLMNYIDVYPTLIRDARSLWHKQTQCIVSITIQTQNVVLSQDDL